MRASQAPGPARGWRASEVCRLASDGSLRKTSGQSLSFLFLSSCASFSAASMAVNAESGAAPVQRDSSSNGRDFRDTEKLLAAAPPAAVAPDPRGSIRSLDAEQNGHRSPLKSGSVGQLAAAPGSSSRLSLASGGPADAAAPGPAPPSYLWLAVLSCLCPGVPLNVCALWYASVSRSVLNNGDVVAARKYGRVSLLLSLLAMLLGVAVIVFIVFTIELQQ